MVGDQFVHSVGSVDRHIDADLLHHLVDEAIGLAGADTGGADDEPARESSLRASAAAIGERTEFIEQTNEHGGQVALALVDAARKGLHGADQGEQAPRGVEVHLELVVEAGAQQLGRFVVEAAARHVDGFDLDRSRRS